MKVLLETDVLMDVALGRADFGPASRALIEWCQHTPQTAVVAWPTISNLFYLLSAAHSDSFARLFLGDLLNFAIVASGGTEGVRHALTMPMSDFEDALQVAAAVSAEAQLLSRENIADYRRSPVQALRPNDFLKRFV